MFKLDNAAKALKYFPEEKVRDQLASLLKIEAVSYIFYEYYNLFIIETTSYIANFRETF